MAKCNFCGRESDCHDLKECCGYYILECCTDCEAELLADAEQQEEGDPQ